jgi:hypothetical protein
MVLNFCKEVINQFPMIALFSGVFNEGEVSVRPME